jgi:hypothetical protein
MQHILDNDKAINWNNRLFVQVILTGPSARGRGDCSVLFVRGTPGSHFETSHGAKAGSPAG